MAIEMVNNEVLSSNELLQYWKCLWMMQSLVDADAQVDDVMLVICLIVVTNSIVFISKALTLKD